MRANDIRKAYLDFFSEKGHKMVPSARLMPENDPTTLFTGSGMQPILPYLLGASHPFGTRIMDSQKCFRAGDIEEVGDNRHTTFFEMLGNWSFGDYFKEEQITWVWEFLTEKIELDPKHLYFTCFRGNESLGIPKDTESAELWRKLFVSVGIDAKIVDFPERDGMQGGRIFYYDETKNWWSRAGIPGNMPEGEPGGPDTEMFWDFGEEHSFHATSEWKDAPCHVNCDCGRFMEIGNNVFMEYRKIAAGFEKLKQKNVDYGGGLERLMAAKRNDPDMFLGDIFDTVRETLEKLSEKRYGEDPKQTFAFRVVIDHMRAAVFLIADGVTPSNTDQGYVLRRLLRRAVRFADVLGVESGSLSSCVEAVVSEYQAAYPYLVEKKEYIASVIRGEENKFRETLTRGMKELEKAIIHLESKELGTGEVVLSKNYILGGDKIFDLFQSYGFPVELTEELAKEKGILIDKKKFEELKKAHSEESRTASAGKFKGGLSDHSAKVTAFHTVTHLMLAGLRKELGDNVHQAGSNITEERTRFDFTCSEKVPREVLDRVETYVNAVIDAEADVTTEVTEKDVAKRLGIEGSFWEKYPEKVTVYQVTGPDGTVYSRELCGGPHVTNTCGIAAFGHFKIIKEEACSAGVRRIKAVLE